jgi:hypothetical protein
VPSALATFCKVIGLVDNYWTDTQEFDSIRAKPYCL